LRFVFYGQVLLNRLRTGRWDTSALDPADLNSRAAALTGYNIYFAGGQVVPMAPAFVQYHPAPYLRPFDLTPPQRTLKRPAPALRRAPPPALPCAASAGGRARSLRLVRISQVAPWM
jgi:hypothetical protein